MYNLESNFHEKFERRIEISFSLNNGRYCSLTSILVLFVEGDERKSWSYDHGWRIKQEMLLVGSPFLSPMIGVGAGNWPWNLENVEWEFPGGTLPLSFRARKMLISTGVRGCRRDVTERKSQDLSPENGGASVIGRPFTIVKWNGVAIERFPFRRSAREPLYCGFHLSWTDFTNTVHEHECFSRSVTRENGWVMPRKFGDADYKVLSGTRRRTFIPHSARTPEDEPRMVFYDCRNAN